LEIINNKTLLKRLQIVNEDKYQTVKLNSHGLNQEELNSILNIINKFAVFEKNSNDSNLNNSTITMKYSPIYSRINVYKHINLYFLLKDDEEVSQETLDKIKEVKINSINIFVKYLYYNYKSKRDIIRSEDFYSDLKSCNPYLTFEELNDEDSINIILHNNNKDDNKQIHAYYNKDINNDIYSFNFEHNLSEELLFNIINLRIINVDIKSLFNSNIPIEEIIEINNSESVNFAKLLVTSLTNLEKLNKIFPLYESIKTIENVKEKVFILSKF
jgi:hypothetical protein